jgi:hypothetical protein
VAIGASDRYASLDVHYLLQRLQDFDGVAILACRRKVEDLGSEARNFSCVIELTPRD